MSTRRQIQKRGSLKSSFTPPANPLKTRGFGKGIQARSAQLPKANPLQTRPFGSPIPASAQQEETQYASEQLEIESRLGYNGLDVPVNAPATPPPPVQRKSASGGLENQQKQQTVPEVEATSEEVEEILEGEEPSSKEASQNQESPPTEGEGEGVPSRVQSESESGKQQPKMPSLQAQLEKASKFGYNGLNVPVNAPGTPSPSVQRKLTLDGGENQASGDLESRLNASKGGDLALASGAIYEQKAGRVAAQITSMPDNSPQVQRDTKANVAIGASAQGIPVSLNIEPSKEFPVKFAKVKFSFPTGVQAQLQSKSKLPANIGGESKSDGSLEAKASAVVYQDEAIAAGQSKFADLAYKEIDPDGFAIDRVEWDNKLSTGIDEDTSNDKASIATAIKFTFKNGQQSSVEATLFEQTAGVGLKGPKLTLDHTFKFPDAILWENDSAQLLVGGEIKAKIEIEPNWTEIFAELAAKKGGRQVAKNFARAALRGITSLLLSPASFLVGGALTLAVAYQEMQSISAIEECKEAAIKAVEGYVHGFCISWGIQDYGDSGSVQWFFEGMNDGSSRLYKQIRKIQKYPVFAPYGFTDDELRVTLKGGLKNHGPTVYKMVNFEVKDKIYTEYVRQFYHKRNASWLTPTYIARKDAIWVARGLGLSDDVVPVEE